MTSIILTTPKAGIQEAVPIWLKIDWSPEIEQGIYKDWGKYYSRRRRENIAMHYFDKALNFSNDDYMTLYYRSQSKRKTAKADGALKDSMEAKRIVRNLLMENSPINLEICDALYELNQFENAKAELHDNTRLFSGNKTKSFENRLVVVDENIIDACGEGLSPFILENEKLMYHVKELLNAKMKVDERPLWKILSDLGKCDVLSIPEIEEKILSPLEIARRKRAFDVCNQVYINKSWIDVLFLKSLRYNPNLLLDQCKNSKEFLGTLAEKQNEVVRKFLKMIHARSPMYFERYKKYTNQSMSNKFREALLFRIQYQTRRNMISVLRCIRRLRNDQNLSKLSKYVEEIMGDYVVLKTNRIMPWKFEFINEVYNTLALALAEQYYVPKNFRPNEKSALLTLLRHCKDKSKDIQKFVFGDRSTHQNQDFVDPIITKSRRMIARLEKRMVFAKYSIEKCYLLHQIASIHLQSNRYDECCFISRKAIEETKNCNSYLWSFLSTMLIVKSNAALSKTERTNEALKNALQIAEMLNHEQLTQFVELCISCNERVSIKGTLSAAPSQRGSKSSTRASTFATV